MNTLKYNKNKALCGKIKCYKNCCESKTVYEKGRNLDFNFGSQKLIVIGRKCVKVHWLEKKKQAKCGVQIQEPILRSSK